LILVDEAHTAGGVHRSDTHETKATGGQHHKMMGDPRLRESSGRMTSRPDELDPM
jgi:hypothetical protein